ncbi:hypothetical protein [Paenibacillus sp. NPDC058071]|uniref:hypothetical protein n=1 Tax=Paenibacillus sp. NPDC058071 TaxID=3346326 RepID=UPI0036DA3DCE
MSKMIPSFTSSRKIKTLLLGLALASAVVLPLSLAGCSSNPSTRQVKTYGHDGYMGYSNSNPNIPNNFSYLNYKSDGRFAGQVLNQLKSEGVAGNSLHFNGEHLRADLTLSGNLTEEQAEELRLKAEKVLQYNMPRYKVKARIVG